MKKLLITGFEPFGGESTNPSWDALLRLPSEIGEYSLTRLCIPVVFGKGAEAVINAATKEKPDVILCIGQAGGRDAVTPELVAINHRHGRISDNEGNQPIDEKIVIGGAPAYFTTIPVRDISGKIRDGGIPSRVSYTLGVYVCNDVFYSVLRHFDGTDTRVGFIHVPYSTEQQKEPSMDLDEIARAIKIAIENL